VTWKRWLFTIVSFAVVIGVSLYFIVGMWRAGGRVSLPARAHAWALLAVVVEIVARSVKLAWGARALGIDLPVSVSMRTILAGDLGASLTPARSGAEPARFLVLKEAGVPVADSLVVLYMELFLEMLSLAAVVLVAVLVLPEALTTQRGLISGLTALVVTYTLVILGTAVLAVWIAKREHPETIPRWARRLRLSQNRWSAVIRSLAKVRMSVERVAGVHKGWFTASFLASAAHVAMRLCVLPALIYGAGASAPLAPLALWPLALLYGTALVPAPGGFGAVEFTFKRALDGPLGAFLPAALLWWRFYTFYLYIFLGGIAAGRTAMRAMKETDDFEAELVTGEEA
jgi:uncharacterized protein (TIRG00374 family)